MHIAAIDAMMMGDCFYRRLNLQYLNCKITISPLVNRHRAMKYLKYLKVYIENHIFLTLPH